MSLNLALLFFTPLTLSIAGEMVSWLMARHSK
jgi:hypothetical protein